MGESFHPLPKKLHLMALIILVLVSVIIHAGRQVASYCIGKVVLTGANGNRRAASLLGRNSPHKKTSLSARGAILEPEGSLGCTLHARLLA